MSTQEQTNRSNLQKSSSLGTIHPRLINLDISFLNEVCNLEERCYPSPWSRRLIAGEFEKIVSIRPSFILENILVAYSFNYLVEDELHILNLAVHPEYRGMGLGRALLRQILLQGFNGGATYATLEVRQSNLVAQSLYDSLGFNIVGRRRHYYRDNGEHALILDRELSSASIDLSWENYRKNSKY